MGCGGGQIGDPSVEPELVVQQRDAVSANEEEGESGSGSGASNGNASSSTKDGSERPLVAVWLQSAFYCRLDIMRDLYQQHLEKVRQEEEENQGGNQCLGLEKELEEPPDSASG